LPKEKSKKEKAFKGENRESVYG